MAFLQVGGFFQRFRLAISLGLVFVAYAGSVTAYSRWEESVPERAGRRLYRGMSVAEVERALAPARLVGHRVWSPNEPWRTFDDDRREVVTFHGIASSCTLQQTGVNVLGTRPDLCFLFDSRGRLRAYSVKRYGFLLEEGRTWPPLPVLPPSA